MRPAICLVVLVLAAGPVDAQLMGPTIAPEDTSRMVTQRPPVGAIRLAASSGGFIWGAVAGGYIGHEAQANDCSKCASRRLNSLVGGAIIGGALGAAFGASVLNLSSPCSFNHRLLRSFIGAGIGASTAYAASGGLDHGGHSAFFIPVAAVGGALGTLGHCWKSNAS
jgi:hypothetical protein